MEKEFKIKKKLRKHFYLTQEPVPFNLENIFSFPALWHIKKYYISKMWERNYLSGHEKVLCYLQLVSVLYIHLTPVSLWFLIHTVNSNNMVACFSAPKPVISCFFPGLWHHEIHMALTALPLFPASSSTIGFSLCLALNLHALVSTEPYVYQSELLRASSFLTLTIDATWLWTLLELFSSHHDYRMRKRWTVFQRHRAWLVQEMTPIVSPSPGCYVPSRKFIYPKELA